MKLFILLLILVAIGFSTPGLPAQHERYSAPITQAEIHPQSAFSKDQLQEGVVSVNLSLESIQLRLLLRPDCASGRYCDAILKEWEVSLRLRSVYTTPCGAKVYKGSTLLGSMSTTYQELIVTDFTSSHCMEPTVGPATQIEYRQIDFAPGRSNSVDQRSSFAATELRLKL